MKIVVLPLGALGSHTQGATPMASEHRARALLLGTGQVLRQRSWLECSSTTGEVGTMTLQVASAGNNSTSCTS